MSHFERGTGAQVDVKHGGGGRSALKGFDCIGCGCTGSNDLGPCTAQDARDVLGEVKVVFKYQHDLAGEGRLAGHVDRPSRDTARYRRIRFQNAGPWLQRELDKGVATFGPDLDLAATAQFVRHALLDKLGAEALAGGRRPVRRRGSTLCPVQPEKGRAIGLKNLPDHLDLAVRPRQGPVLQRVGGQLVDGK